MKLMINGIVIDATPTEACELISKMSRTRQEKTETKPRTKRKNFTRRHWTQEENEKINSYIAGNVSFTDLVRSIERHSKKALEQRIYFFRKNKK